MKAEAAPEKESVLFTEILREAMGISDKAADAFRVLLTIGPLTIGEISTYSGLGYAIASKALLELENERLVRRIPAVVPRFTAMPPYGGFVAFLKDFQKISKDIADDSTNVVNSTLITVGRNSTEFKKEAQQTAMSTLSQTMSENNSLKENSSRNASEMMGKLKEEIESTKGMVTDAIKKHVDEHKSKSIDANEELASGIDGTAGRFETIGRKYLKEVTDTTSLSLEKYKANHKSYLETSQSNLQDYSTEARDRIALLERVIMEIQGKLEDKARSTITLVKATASDTLDNQRKVFGQKSLELQSTTREAMDNLTRTFTSGLAKLKSSIDSIVERLATDTSKSLSDFSEKTTASLAERGSKYESDLNESGQSLHKTIDTLVDSLNQESERLNSSARESVENSTSTTKSSLEELEAKISEVHSTGLTNFTGAMSATKGGLKDTTVSSLSSCKSIASTLESTSSAIVPRYSAALEKAASEIEKNTENTMLRISKKNDASMSEVSEKAIGYISSSIPSLRKEVDKVLDRVLSSVASASSAERSSTAASKKTSGGTKSLTADVKELFNEAIARYEKNVVNELRESLKKDTKAEKASFEDELSKIEDGIKEILSDSVKNVKLELSKTGVAVAGHIPKLTEYCSSIEKLVRQVELLIDASMKQYTTECQVAKKATEELLSKQRQDLEDALRGVSLKIDADKASVAKKVSDLGAEAHGSLSSTVTRLLEDLDQNIRQNKSTLSELVSQGAKDSDAARSLTQTNITNHVNATLGASKDITESITNNVRAALTSVAGSYDDSTAALQKDLGGMVTQSVDEIKSSSEEAMSRLAESKETLTRRVDEITEKVSKEINELSSRHVNEIVSAMSASNGSLSKLTNASTEAFKSEAAGSKDRFNRIITSHLQSYEQEAFGASGTCGYLLSRSYEKYREVSMVNEKKLMETLLTNQTRFENAVNKVNSTLISLIERDEALIKEETKNSLASFRESIDKLRKASAGVEGVLHSAWIEIEKTPHLAVERTWQAVTRTAIMAHIQEMIKRTRSSIIVALPTLAEAPLEDILNVKKATRVTLIVAGITGDVKETEMLAAMSRQANITIRVSPNLFCFGCTRDSEEMLFAPVAETDNETVAIVSTMENYIMLFERIILPALLGSSSDFREPTGQRPSPTKPQ